MDLQTAIAKLTAAVEANTAALLAVQKPAPSTEREQAPVVNTAPAPTLTYDGDVKPAALGYIAEHGKDALRALLADFGVAKATELPASRWIDFINRVRSDG